jgi:hypothetical protein
MVLFRTTKTADSRSSASPPLGQSPTGHGYGLISSARMPSDGRRSVHFVGSTSFVVVADAQVAAVVGTRLRGSGQDRAMNEAGA